MQYISQNNSLVWRFEILLKPLETKMHSPAFKQTKECNIQSMCLSYKVKLISGGASIKIPASWLMQSHDWFCTCCSIIPSALAKWEGKSTASAQEIHTHQPIWVGKVMDDSREQTQARFSNLELGIQGKNLTTDTLGKRDWKADSYFLKLTETELGLQA